MAAPQQAPAEAAQPLKTRPKKPPKLQLDHCLNCGAGATGKFCAQCGQENKDHSVALGPLLCEGLAELASWDSKLLRTLVPLIIRPGFLTNEYNAGRRASYLSPLKLYLTISVLFFLLLSWAYPVGDNIQMQLGGVPIGQDSGSRAKAIPHTAAEYEAGQRALPAAQRDIPFQQWMTRHAYKAKQSPQGFVSTLVGDIPKMMFFLLPLFAVTLKLLYLRTKQLYVEHLIFLLHVHAFAFLAFIPLLLVHPLFHPGWLTITVFLSVLVYVIFAMHTVYRQGWIKTSVKFSLLGFGYVLLLLFCFAGTVLATLWLL